MATKLNTAGLRSGKAMPGGKKWGNAKPRDAGIKPSPPPSFPLPVVQTPNTATEVAFAKNLSATLGPGYKHTGGTSGSESITKGGK